MQPGVAGRPELAGQAAGARVIISTVDYRGASLVRATFDPAHWELVQGPSMLNQEVRRMLDGLKGS